MAQFVDLTDDSRTEIFNENSHPFKSTTLPNTSQIRKPFQPLSNNAGAPASAIHRPAAVSHELADAILNAKIEKLQNVLLNLIAQSGEGRELVEKLMVT